MRGRKSGRLYSTPVNLLETGGRKFLIAPRGRTQWVRNVEVTGEIMLKKDNSIQKFRTLAIPEAERPVLLKPYVQRFTASVQWYFSVAAGSSPEAFRSHAVRVDVRWIRDRYRTGDILSGGCDHLNTNSLACGPLSSSVV